MFEVFYSFVYCLTRIFDKNAKKIAKKTAKLTI